MGGVEVSDSHRPEVGMCGVTAVAGDIRVSVQEVGAPDWRSGHLAVGLLVDSDVVLVPAPPSLLAQDDVDLQVVIMPACASSVRPTTVPRPWPWPAT